jgi:hypothetical protein
MCIFRQFCELSLTIHLFPDKSVLHQVDTAMTLTTLVASMYFYPQTVVL